VASRGPISGIGALIAAATLLACAEAVVSPERDDAAPAQPSLPTPSGFSPPPTLDAAAFPTEPPAAPDARVPPSGQPGTCTPGLCLECDAQGRGLVPADDAACPALDCTALDTYTLSAEGESSVCTRQVHVATGRRCLGPGQCKMAPDPVSCADVRPVEQARTTSICEVMAGCAGGTEGTLGPAADGEPCGDAGVCRPNGMCDTTLADRCPGYDGAHLCDAGVHVTGEQYCDVSVADTTCLAACQGFGRPCLAAFASEPEAPCRLGEPMGCLTAGPSLRCRCQNR
jgi:hypothetical protein